MRQKSKFVLGEIRTARALWGDFSSLALRGLTDLLCTNHFCIAAGDLLYLESRWYVTHAGLLRLALRNRCVGIDTKPVRAYCNPDCSKWAFKATVYKSPKCRGFVGHGDADPSNVSPLVHGAEMRVAETRAVNRALRKAYGIGICSVEEIGSFAEPLTSSRESKKLPPQPVNGNYGGPKIRDRLCQIIRQHQLDATLVKSYARFLRHQDAARGDPRAGRTLRHPPGRLGRERQEGPALSAQ